jgi:class 3 adenylate cyclase
MREDFLQDNRLFVEQRKTQVMLNTLMPRHVSAALVDPNAKGQSIVHYEGSVSILFCDIVNFSDMVATVRSASLWSPCSVAIHIPKFSGRCSKSGCTCSPFDSSVSLSLFFPSSTHLLPHPQIRHSHCNHAPFPPPCTPTHVTNTCAHCACLLQHSPTQLVRLLDAIYSMFDVLCIKHDVTKMETVGKTFMAASGLQGDRKNHAQALVLLGMDMIRTVAMVRDKSGKPAITVRVGINSGNVVSGVVGCKKQQFSLFGDCVNTASRMQSCAKMGELRVSSTTKVCLGADVETTLRVENIKVREWAGSVLFRTSFLWQAALAAGLK